MYHNVAYTLIAIALEQAIKEPVALNDEDKKYLKAFRVHFYILISPN